MILVAKDVNYNTSLKQIVTMNPRAIAARLVQAMMLGMFLATTAFGQSGLLRGFVTDQHGAVVPGATVAARGPTK